MKIETFERAGEIREKINEIESLEIGIKERDFFKDTFSVYNDELTDDFREAFISSVNAMKNKLEKDFEKL